MTRLLDYSPHPSVLECVSILPSVLNKEVSFVYFGRMDKIAPHLGLISDVV